MIRSLSISVLLGLLVSSQSLAESPFVAGLAPDRRPVDAPVITALNKDDDWYETALFGVVPPYPSSLRFLEDQGHWFTPFKRPGMTGPYDIRGWHKEN